MLPFFIPIGILSLLSTAIILRVLATGVGPSVAEGGVLLTTVVVAFFTLKMTGKV